MFYYFIVYGLAQAREITKGTLLIILYNSFVLLLTRHFWTKWISWCQTILIFIFNIIGQKNLRSIVNQNDVWFFFGFHERNTLYLIVHVWLFINTTHSRSWYTLGHHLIIGMRSVGRKLWWLHVSIAKILLIRIVTLFGRILTSIWWLLIFFICDFIVLCFLDWISFWVVPWLYVTHFLHIFTFAWRWAPLPHKTGSSRTWFIWGFCFRVYFGGHFWALSRHSGYRAWCPRIYRSLSRSYLVLTT